MTKEEFIVLDLCKKCTKSQYNNNGLTKCDAHNNDHQTDACSINCRVKRCIKFVELRKSS